MNLICSARKAGHQRSLSRRPQPQRELQGEANKSVCRRTAALRPRAAGGCGKAQAGALRRLALAATYRTMYKGRAGHLVFVIGASGQLAWVSQGLCVHRLCVPAPGTGSGRRRTVLCLSVSWNSCLILESFSLKFGEWEEKNLPLHVLVGCKIWVRWQTRIWRQTGGLAGFVPHIQSLHKHYVNLSNFCEMLSVSLLHVQDDSGEDWADQPKECRASTRLAQSWGHAFGLASTLLLVLSTVKPQGTAVCLHISKPIQFSGPLRCSESTKVVKLPNFVVARFWLHLWECTSGHIQAMGKPAVYFWGVTTYITQLSSLFSIFKRAKIACLPQSSWSVWAIYATGNLLCQRQLCANSKPSQSMSSP